MNALYIICPNTNNSNHERDKISSGIILQRFQPIFQKATKSIHDMEINKYSDMEYF